MSVTFLIKKKSNFKTTKVIQKKIFRQNSILVEIYFNRKIFHPNHVLSENETMYKNKYDLLFTMFSVHIRLIDNNYDHL